MRTLHISVQDKKATYASRDGDIVCGNSDYEIQFAFDAEWNGYADKVARFIWNGDYKDVEFTGTTCPVPMVTNTKEIQVGVYAGDLSTTTPAIIGCQRSILCGNTVESDVPVIASNIYIRYSKYADGTDFTETWSNNYRYIGVATGRSAPTDKSGYAWSLFTAGNVIHAAHIRFSAYPDGTDFTDTWSAGLVYMGIAIDAVAPTDKADYEWMRIASNIRQTVSVTLQPDAWVDNKQVIETAHIGDDTSGFANPKPESMSAYIEHGVKLDALSVRSLTFSCVSVPKQPIAVDVDLTEPLVRGRMEDGEQPTDSKYVMRDEAGNLSAFTPDHMAYPNLLYSYTHQQNKEVYPTALNLATGEWTAVGHGLTQNQQVFVAIHPPYHIIKSYDQLPGGLLLGPGGGGGLNAQKYYVNVVDADTFTLSETSGGAVKTYTEVATMDLSRFHFEVFVQQPITIGNLPDLTEMLVVIKGRVSNGYRYIRTDGRASLSGKIPVVQYDHAYVDTYGSMYIGNGGGWGSLYATVEMQFVEDKHLMLTFNVDTMCHKTDGVPIARHERAYVHYYMTVDTIKTVYLQQGQFMNGTTVEVYTK